ncbi:acyl carrier protein [Mongoliimonas terrestris]|uniref:acyl carrier protein n=1 Tax=Mongoliimonas terrestris TaxID=1709001 RepID=UPI0009497F68|nr:acyl carrier protein [Mongoliimonas terrestris]
MSADIRTLLASHGGLPVDVATLADDADLYGAGLSSFASVQLMLALEDTFEIEFPDRMLNRRTFASIRSITDAVTELVAEREAAA